MSEVRTFPQTRRAVVGALVAFGAFGAAVLVACSEAGPVNDPSDASSDSVSDAPKDSSATDARDATAEAAACKLVKPYASKDVDCNQCAEQNCCAEVNECLTTKNCDEEYVNCLFACQLGPEDAGGDAVATFQKCAAKCRTDYPVGAGLFDALNACVDGACKTECE